jgi:hypothetical protein
VGSLIADIREGAAALNDLHEQLVAAGQSLIAATTATLAELSNTLASATAQVATEQMDALEEILALKVEESVRLTAALAGTDFGYAYLADGEFGTLYYPYALVTPLEFGGVGASGVQVMHAITGSATVTLVSPLPVVAGGAITGTVTAISIRSGDRSSFQEQLEIPTPEVGLTELKP